MAKHNESTKTSYFNTLIFTIVSGIISLLLLLTLFSKIVRNNAFYFIIAVEIGIFSVIAICVIKIITNEQILNNLKNKLSTQKISMNDCPDYFIKTEKDDIAICTNNYEVQTGNGRKYMLRIYPASVTLPNMLPVTNQDKNEKFKLYQLEQSSDLVDAKAQCAMVMTEPNINSAATAAQKETLSQYKGYSSLPWLYARSRCGPYIN